MKPFRWSAAKGELLLAQRGVGFETVVATMLAGCLLDVLAHPNPERDPGQRIAVVDVGGYTVLVPYAEGDGHPFRKTVMPSRKVTRACLGGRNDA